MDLARTPARRPMEPGLARRLWHVVLAVCHMLRRGLGRKRLMMDLHLLLGRGKLAGRALRGHITSSSSSAALAAWRPREVEFSCTTTPSFPQQHYGGGLFLPFKGRGGRGAREYGGLDAAAVARAFEMMSADVESGRATPAATGASAATPSPMVAWILGRSPAGVRPLRVTDSPFPVVPEDGGGERVNAEAEDFIRRFYEQLRMQHPSVATPEYY